MIGLLYGVHQMLRPKSGRRTQANRARGYNFSVHRNRLIETQSTRTISSDLGQRCNLAALHHDRMALASTANTDVAK